MTIYFGLGPFCREWGEDVEGLNTSKCEGASEHLRFRLVCPGRLAQIPQRAMRKEDEKFSQRTWAAVAAASEFSIGLQ